MGQTRPLFLYFRHFLNPMTNTVQNLTLKSVDGVLGTRTWGGNMVGADESTEPHHFLLGTIRFGREPFWG